MRRGAAPVTLTLTFLIALAQLLAGLVSPLVAIACGGLAAGVCLLVIASIDVALDDVETVAVPTVGSVVGIVVLSFVPDLRQPIVWASPVAAAAVAAVGVLIRAKRAARCRVCQRRLVGRLAFTCPRCGLAACDGCWVFEYCRCRDCEDKHVPLFKDEWFERQLGARMTAGRCGMCHTPADAPDATLRACIDCGRPQCEDCWDGLNGHCGHCGWIAGDLPDALRRYVTSERRRPFRATS